MEGACKYAYYSITRRLMLGSTVEFTNSAGRKIRGTVTIVDKGWVTVVETMGSAYKLPASTVRVVDSSVK